MSRINSLIGRASTALAFVIVGGFAVGPETLTRRVDEVLADSWRALGDRLASRELDTIARELEDERHAYERIGVLRDGLDEKVRALGV